MIDRGRWILAPQNGDQAIFFLLLFSGTPYRAVWVWSPVLCEDAIFLFCQCVLRPRVWTALPSRLGAVAAWGTTTLYRANQCQYRMICWIGSLPLWWSLGGSKPPHTFRSFRVAYRVSFLQRIAYVSFLDALSLSSYGDAYAYSPPRVKDWLSPV